MCVKSDVEWYMRTDFLKELRFSVCQGIGTILLYTFLDYLICDNN